jgi:acyl-CoA dehydrogenase
VFADAIEDILVRHCTPATVRAIEGGGSAQGLTDAISGAGFYELMVPESAGGGGAGWGELFEIVSLCGTFAVPIPLAQTLASRAIVSDPDSLPKGLITFAPLLSEATDGSLHAPHVPLGRVATHVVAAFNGSFTLLASAEALSLPLGVHSNLDAAMSWKSGSGTTLQGSISADRLQSIGALLHAGLMAGAMKRVFDLTLKHANDRVQFGKSIGKFQAIQHQVSIMAEQVTAANIAAEAGFGTVRETTPRLVCCAVAKARASEAAQVVASIAHAVHGAIGVTDEYDLQLYTRRLHTWRVAHGSETYWHRVLGKMFAHSPLPLATDFVRSLC